MQIEIANNENRAPDRSLAIILKDFEQETCIMLAIWALTIMWIKWSRAKEQINLLSSDLMGTAAKQTIYLNEIKDLEDSLSSNSHGLLKRFTSCWVADFFSLSEYS